MNPTLNLTMTPAQLEAARLALLGPFSDALIDHVVRINLYQPQPPHLDASVAALARQLGWVSGEGAAAPLGLSTLGQLVSTSLREYTFWVQRQRTAHGEGRHPAFANAAYAGLDVLEVGSGWGCNLVSLQPHARRVLGVEPTAVYRQLTPILCEREGVPTVAVVDGLGEALPLADASFDVVICYSSHQYMDTRAAFADMARVLRRGGQLQLVCGVFDQVMGTLWSQIKAHPRPSLLKHATEVVVNTLSYQHLGRRLLRRGWQGTTDAPIYAQQSHQAKWLEAVGLSVRHDLTLRDGSDCIMVAQKR